MACAYDDARTARLLQETSWTTVEIRCCLATLNLNNFAVYDQKHKVLVLVF